MDKKKKKLVSDKTSNLLYGIFFLAVALFFIIEAQYYGLLIGFFGVIMLVFSIMFLFVWWKNDALDEKIKNRPPAMTPEEEFRADVNRYKEILGMLSREQIERVFIAMNNTGKYMGWWEVKDYSDRLAKVVIAANSLLNENIYSEISYEQKKAIDKLLSDYELKIKIYVPAVKEASFSTASGGNEREIRKSIEFANSKIDSMVYDFISNIEKVVM